MIEGQQKGAEGPVPRPGTSVRVGCDGSAYARLVDQPGEPTASPHVEGPVDLSALERIEGELEAVERALEQIDQGVYKGFEGLDLPAAAGATPRVPDAEDVVPEI